MFQQHDIQELCRILFEAIELSLDQAETNFINHIFEGNTQQIIKCNKCSYLSTKSEKFLDLSLPIRNDFDKIYNSSLEMALMNFLKPEELNNDNKYDCSQCKEKVNSIFYTGPSFEILSLHKIT